jgi:hypothetical protein
MSIAYCDKRPPAKEKPKEGETCRLMPGHQGECLDLWGNRFVGVENGR